MKHRFSMPLLGVISLLLFFWGGCSKDGPGEPGGEGEYFFHFKVDGQTVSYPFTPAEQINLTAVMAHDPGSGLHVANIAGIKDITVMDQSDRLTFFLGDPKELATAVVYSNVAGAGLTLPGIFSMAYGDSMGDLYIAAINTTEPPLYAPAVLQFTEIGQGHVSGNFSAVLKRYGTSAGRLELLGTLTISEGSFRVPRH